MEDENSNETPSSSVVSSRLFLDSLIKDVLKLMKDFTTTNNYDFGDFKKLWNDRKFYYVHCVFYDAPRRNHSLDMVLQSVTERVCAPIEDSVNLYEKISGVYAWYCLFFTQLQPSFVKIRLTLDDNHNLELLHKTIREKNLHDPDYIICKLKTFSAFHYVVTRQQLCLGQQGDTTNKQLQSLSEQSKVTLEKEVFPVLRDCQESFLRYTSYKLSLANHLPPHLLSSSSPLESLLSPERIKELCEVPTVCSSTSAGLEGEREGEGEEEGETQRRKVLRKASRIKPKRVQKRRDKTLSN